MIWQDVVFLVGGFVFAVLLVPTLRDREARIPRVSSFPTAVLLIGYSVTFVTLGLHLAALANVVGALAWFLIFIYRGGV